MNDLLVHLLDIYIDKGDPPDILAIGFPEDSRVISLGWFCGTTLYYGYTKARWDLVWTRFNEFWQNKIGLKYLFL